MRNGLLAAMLLLGAACGAYQFPGEQPSPTPSTGTVSGRVVAVPCYPVEKPGDTCAGRPVPSLEIDYTSGATVAGRTVTDAKGNYSIELKPGSYVVRMKTYMRVISGPLNLTVAPGSGTVANYVLDSGIRAPAPQQ
jgi:hypothetical protein